MWRFIIGEQSPFSKNTVLRLLSFHYTRAVVKIQVETPLVKLHRKRGCEIPSELSWRCSVLPDGLSVTRRFIALPLINTSAHTCHPLSREKRIQFTNPTVLRRCPCSMFLVLNSVLKNPWRACVETREVWIFSGYESCRTPSLILATRVSPSS